MRLGSRRLPGAGAIVVLAVAVALLITGRDGGDEASDDVEARDTTRAEVLRVIDGDTIEVVLDGSTEDVRYIGIDTPESVAPGQPVECYGKRASAANERLVDGATARLVIGAEPRDPYGRLLAYVYVGDTFVNAELVRRGFARTLTIAPNIDQAPLFDRLERRAADSGRGLWKAC
jgi:micrococcal nuclease